MSPHRQARCAFTHVTRIPGSTALCPPHGVAACSQGPHVGQAGAVLVRNAPQGMAEHGPEVLLLRVACQLTLQSVVLGGKDDQLRAERNANTGASTGDVPAVCCCAFLFRVRHAGRGRDDVLTERTWMPMKSIWAPSGFCFRCVSKYRVLARCLSCCGNLR